MPTPVTVDLERLNVPQVAGAQSLAVQLSAALWIEPLEDPYYVLDSSVSYRP